MRQGVAGWIDSRRSSGIGGYTVATGLVLLEDAAMHIDMLAFAWPGPFEMLCIMGIGLLFFGSRLPEVGKSLGKTITEFKKGMREVEDDNEAQALEAKRKAALADRSNSGAGPAETVVRQEDTVRGA